MRSVSSSSFHVVRPSVRLSDRPSCFHEVPAHPQELMVPGGPKETGLKATCNGGRGTHQDRRPVWGHEQATSKR